MRAHITGIDHAVIAVHDLDHARETYARLGFTLTPRGTHTLGSQNHCIMFGSDYIELLAMTRAHPALQFVADTLARGDGFAAVALATGDAGAAQEALVRAAIPVQAPMTFSRPVESAQGARDAVFRIAQVEAGFVAGARIFLCEHRTPGLLRRPEWCAHPLGATGIAALAIVVDDPALAARNYATLFDEAPHAIAEGLLVRTGSAPLALVTRGRLGKRLEGAALPLRARPFVAAVFIRVEDRARAAAVLRKGGFTPVALRDGSFAVDADAAHGVTLVFG